MRKAALPSQVTAAFGEQLSFLPTPEFSSKWLEHTSIALYALPPAVIAKVQEMRGAA